MRCPYTSEHANAGADRYRRGTAIQVRGSLYSVRIPAHILDDRPPLSLQTCVCNTCIPYLHIGNHKLLLYMSTIPDNCPFAQIVRLPSVLGCENASRRKCDEIPALTMSLQPALSITQRAFLAVHVCMDAEAVSPPAPSIGMYSGCPHVTTTQPARCR